MRAIPPVWRVVRIATAVVAIGIPVPVAAVAVAVSDAQAATPIARVAIDAAVGRTVAVVVIIDRRLSVVVVAVAVPIGVTGGAAGKRSEEHTSELQSLMRISYAVFCLKKKKKQKKKRI